MGRQRLSVAVDLAHLSNRAVKVITNLISQAVVEVVFTDREGVVKVKLISWGKLMDTM